MYPRTCSNLKNYKFFRTSVIKKKKSITSRLNLSIDGSGTGRSSNVRHRRTSYQTLNIDLDDVGAKYTGQTTGQSFAPVDLLVLEVTPLANAVQQVSVESNKSLLFLFV